MSVLTRYTVKEILSNLAGVLAIILGIFLVRRFAQLLADATEGSFPIDAIFSLLELRTLMALPSLLPVVLYVAVLLGLGRLYQDQEMTALAGCGVPPARIRRAVLTFAAVAAAVIAVLTFSVRPWAAERHRQEKRSALAESGLGQMKPGRFYALGEGNEEVFFADARSELDPGVLRQVFVQTRRKGRLSVFFADMAIEQRDEAHGIRFLRLFNGHRYDLDTKHDDHQITTYQEFSIRTPLEAEAGGSPSEEASSASALFHSSDPRDVSELQWRVAMPVSAFLLVFLAIPLSHTNPRQGKYAKLMVAIFLYFAYRNLLGAMRSWISDGTLAPFPGLWSAHAVCLVVSLCLYAGEPEWRDRWAFWWRGSTAGRSGAAA